LRLNSLPRFFRFALVGCAGYGVDVAALYFAIYGLGAGLYWGRVFSYLCASSSTWYMNRLITFADVRSDKFAGEWLKFVVLNGVGGVVNYTTYTIYLHYGFSFAGISFAATPAVAVALGSLSGLGVNYILSRKLVFPSAPEKCARLR
jgi:putative flippase GtrA